MTLLIVAALGQELAIPVAPDEPAGSIILTSTGEAHRAMDDDGSVTFWAAVGREASGPLVGRVAVAANVDGKSRTGVLSMSEAVAMRKAIAFCAGAEGLKSLQIMPWSAGASCSFRTDAGVAIRVAVEGGRPELKVIVGAAVATFDGEGLPLPLDAIDKALADLKAAGAQ